MQGVMRRAGVASILVALRFVAVPLAAAGRCAGKDVSIAGGSARLTAGVPCLGIAIVRRTSGGWRIEQPPFEPAPTA
jgi:hypothetical protein